ncbi:MAG TPA: HAD-IC family P-type ATPase, partial [Cyclobacteriaceae bacterium]|nr:HAD-IC family P-type ATPase [Cyclobacteriaceae bacterium]
MKASSHNFKSDERSANKQTPTNWHALSVDEAFRLLNTSDNGLVAASVSDRLLSYGPNKLPEHSGKNPIIRFLKHFDNLLIYILLVSAVITALMGNWLVTGVIFGVELINAIIGFIQEGKAERAINAIGQMLSEHARVKRDGRLELVPAEDLVPGDVVLLKAGDKVPADLRLFESGNLKIEEAILTGESLPVGKDTQPKPLQTLPADRKCLAYSGTLVTNGSGQGVVINTGIRTELGQISKMMGEVKTLTTPLLKKVDRFGKVLAVSIIILSIIFFALGHFIHSYTHSELFIIVVGLAVAMIPEGLPVLMTIVLAKGVQKMARNNAIIRKLPSVETLGEVTVVCSDKTGTLTKNEMTVTDVVMPGNHFAVTGAGYSPDGNVLLDNKIITFRYTPELNQLIQCVAWCNNAEANNSRDDWSFVGDPTENALLSLALKSDFKEFKSVERLDIIPFDSSQKFMTVLIKGEMQNTIYVKGAPEKILSLSASQSENGSISPLDEEFWKLRISRLASEGKRIIGAAHKEVSPKKADIQLDDIIDLKFTGLIAMIDPPRPEAIEAISKCHNAGIDVKMITGDHHLTATVIGRQLNISDEINTISGYELEEISDEELVSIAARKNIFARTTPEQKLRLVKALQKNNHVVAMTGDGVNDAPALKRADVGIAMGIKGTDVTKEAAEMILADDNFATISKAIFEGRSIYDNLKKSILFVLPTNGAEGFVMMASILIGGHMPITPLQILWINLVTAVTLGFALAFEPGEPNLENRPPRQPDEPLMDGFLVWRIGFVSILLGAIVLLVHHYLIEFGAGLEHARSASVNTLVAGEAFYLLNCRFMKEPLLGKGLFKNMKVFYSIGTVLLIQIFFTYTPFMNTLFDTTPLHGRELTWVFLGGLLIFIVVEFEKL